MFKGRRLCVSLNSRRENNKEEEEGIRASTESLTGLRPWTLNLNPSDLNPGSRVHHHNFSITLPPKGGARGFRRLGYGYVTKFAPHEAPKLISTGKLTVDERVELHRVFEREGGHHDYLGVV